MLEQLTPRVFHLPFSKEEDKPSLGYIRGEQFSLMIDGGNSPTHVREFQQAVAAAGFPLPHFTILTHSHWDHCFGMSALDIPAIACQQTMESLQLVSSLSWTPTGMEQSIAQGILPRSCAPRIRLHFPDPAQIRIMLPTIVFQEQLTLHLGGCTCHLHHVTSPHARDTVIVFVPEERMVFLGDAVYQELKGDTWTEHPDKLRTLAQTLEPMDFLLAQPSHQKALSKNDLLHWFYRRIQKQETPA